MIAFLRRHGVLLGVLLVGAALRFGALDYGLPRHDLGQDEIVTLGRVRDGALRGTPMAPTYNWPNLNVYLSQLAVKATRRVDRALGLPRHDMLLVGRAVVATVCTLSLFWLYLVGSRLFDRTTGVLCVAFLAVMPLHAFRSRLWVPDAPMTAFYILALLASVWILERPRISRFVWAGVAVGLATSMKYNGAGACLPVIVAAVLARDRLSVPGRWLRLLGRLLLAGAVAVVTFFVVDPLALGHLRELFHGAFWVGELYRDKPPTGFLGWHIMRYVAVSFFSSGVEGVGPFISVLSIAGAIVLLRERSQRAVLVLLPPLLYLVLYSALLRTAYERVFMPLLPHLAIGAGLATVSFARWLEGGVRRRWPAVRLAGGLMVAVVLLSLPPVASQVYAARHGETRVEALRWIRLNVPTGARILREWNMIRPPTRYFQVNEKELLLCKAGLTAEEMASRYDYVVASGTTYEWVFRQRRRPVFDERAAFYQEIFEGPSFELAARFEPDLVTFGPEIRIYRSRQLRGPHLTGDKLELGSDIWARTLPIDGKRSRKTFPFSRYRHLVAGPVVVESPGRYALSATVETPAAAPLRLILDGRDRRFQVEGIEALSVEVDLEEGQAWWSVRPAPGWRHFHRATISELHIKRVEGALDQSREASASDKKVP